MAHSELFIGDIATPLFYFADTDLRSANGALSVDVMGDRLTQDEMEILVEWDSVSENIELFAPYDFDALMDANNLLFATSYTGSESILDISYGLPCWYYFDGALIGKFYAKKLSRTGKASYRLTLMSAVGLLANLIDYGGIYRVLNSDTVKTVLASIIGGSIGAVVNGLYPVTGGVFDFYVEKTVGDLPVEGWLPIATKRENLHQLMFSEGIALTKATDGTPVFSFLFEDLNPPTIPDTDVYIGGEISYPSPATAIEVTEHTFLNLGASDELVTLFDGSVEGTVTDAFVQFDDPCHDLIATGVTISESGANYAIITGNGTLEGRKYTHSQKVIRTVNTASVGETNEVKIADVTMISPLNSANVSARAMEYYGTAKIVDADVRVAIGTPQIGRQYSFTDPFGDAETGFISNLELNASNIMKATAHIITDYVPTGQGNAYKNAVLMSAGNWTVPTGVTAARFVIIGGGGGGSAGSDGANGGTVTLTDFYNTYYHNYDVSTAVGGAGGAGGNGGDNGKVLTVDVSALTPGASLAITYGQGGEQGQNGTDTTITANGTTYTSADGSRPTYGIINLFTGDVYAKNGEQGIKGGDGGGNLTDGESVSFNGTTYIGGKSRNTSAYDTAYYRVYGHAASKIGDLCWAGGGGAAYGANGKDGRPTDTSDYNADGGKGANGVKPPQALYGCGGKGGSGGGGCGSGGISKSTLSNSYYSGNAGTKGTGSVGGKGGDGCVLIYY